MKKLIFTFLLLPVCVITNSQEESWYLNYRQAELKTDQEVSESYEELFQKYQAAKRQQQINELKAELEKAKMKNEKHVEFSLYDKTGHAKAYLTNSTNVLTVYLWNGYPVAYFSKVRNGEIWHIYNFDGKHLGWTHSGICFDNNGYIVCGLRDRLDIATYAERAKPVRKSDKKAKRNNGAKESAPARPVFKRKWSDTSLEEFFHY